MNRRIFAVFCADMPEEGSHQVRARTPGLAIRRAKRELGELVEGMWLECRVVSPVAHRLWKGTWKG